MPEFSTLRDAQGQTARVIATSDDRSQLLTELPDGRQIWVDRGLVDSESRLSVTFASIANGAERVVVPVIEESLRVGRETVETGVVRVHKHVIEREEIIREPVLRDEVEIERVPIGRPVDQAPPVRIEGDTTVYPLLEEVVVVEKRLMLREELRVRTRRSTVPSETPVTLRHEDVSIERTEGAPPTA